MTRCLHLVERTIERSREISFCHFERSREISFCHFERSREICQQALRIADPPARLPQEVPLVGNGDAGTEVVGMEVVDNLIREVMDIHDEVVIPRRHELGNDMVQQRLAAHGHERLRHRVRNGFQAGSQPRGKDHRFHRLTAVEWNLFIINTLHNDECSVLRTRISLS